MDGAASFLAVFFSSVAAFVSTELGKFVLLLVLFAKYPSKRGRFFAGAGKYAALILVTACSAFFASYLHKIPASYVGFLGLIPIGLGIREIFRKKADEKSIAGTTEESGEKVISAVIYTMLVFLAASGTDFAVYIPFFTTIGGWEYLTCAIVFAVLQSVMLILVDLAFSISIIKSVMKKVGHILVPVLLILLGIYILWTNGTVGFVQNFFAGGN